MAFIYSTTTQSGIDVNNVFALDPSYPEYPAAPFLPGELAWGTDGSEWVYCTSVVSLAPGSALLINSSPGSWSVAALSNTNGRGANGQLVGVSGGATGSVTVQAITGTQTGTYFWVQRAGNAQKLLSANSIAATTALHTSATGGEVGTASSGTSAAISGVVFSASVAPSAGANAILNYPTVGAND